MKKLLTKSLLWTLGCALVLFVLLFSVKKGFAASAACAEEVCCKEEMPATNSVEPLWESISHQFVSSVSLY